MELCMSGSFTHFRSLSRTKNYFGFPQQSILARYINVFQSTPNQELEVTYPLESSANILKISHHKYNVDIDH